LTLRAVDARALLVIPGVRLADADREAFAVRFYVDAALHPAGLGEDAPASELERRPRFPVGVRLVFERLPREFDGLFGHDPRHLAHLFGERLERLGPAVE